MRIKVRARTRFLVVGGESGIYVAPVESNGALIITFSLPDLLMDKKYSDWISIGIELYAPYFASGTVNAWSENF